MSAYIGISDAIVDVWTYSWLEILPLMLPTPSILLSFCVLTHTCWLVFIL